MIELRLPNITAQDERGQLLQIKSYLYQMAQQLSLAFTTVEGDIRQVQQTAAAQTSGKTESDALSTFNTVKGLIIKSADIVNAYYEQIQRRLEGEYVAISQFGQYREATSQQITENATGITALYTNIQEITGTLNDLYNGMIGVEAHIKSGLLGYDEDGTPVYGIEVGQRTEVDGEQVFNKYARFTAGRLSFYDANGLEAAYISDRSLHINHAQIVLSLTMGNLRDEVQADGSVVTR